MQAEKSHSPQNGQASPLESHKAAAEEWEVKVVAAPTAHRGQYKPKTYSWSATEPSSPQGPGWM